jgi:hypothetical protein
MNFGHKIALFYGGFVVFMIIMVVMCFKQKDISLVSDDYYKKEIAYQVEIQKHRNTNQLLLPVKVSYLPDNEEVMINFPENLIGSTGKIQLYRPSDAKKDVAFDLNISASNSQKILVNKLTKGLWIVKIEWQKDGKEYLKEEKIVI